MTDLHEIYKEEAGIGGETKSPQIKILPKETSEERVRRMNARHAAIHAHPPAPDAEVHKRKIRDAYNKAIHDTRDWPTDS